MVRKQYVKKFGKLGEAVVNSNMEVMLQGFERVKEIAIGELSAADHSTLRGQALLPILEMATIGGESCTTGGCRSTPPPVGPVCASAGGLASPHLMPSSAPASATTSPPHRSRAWA